MLKVLPQLSLANVGLMGAIEVQMTLKHPHYVVRATE